MEPPLTTFLICGYPRSRTLWLANFFSIPGVSYCDHEATQYAASSADFWARAQTFSSPVYGNSDSAAILVLPALLASRPLTKVIWIERRLEEVSLSMLRAGFHFTLAGAELLRAHKERYRALFDFELHFDALGHMGTMAALWQFILPHVPFDVGRWGQLADKRLALTYQDYVSHPRDTEKFLQFLATEGEPDLLQRRVTG